MHRGARLGADGLRAGALDAPLRRSGLPYGAALTFGVASYDGTIGIFPTACRKVVPDPEFRAGCLDESTAEVRELIAICPPSPAPLAVAPPDYWPSRQLHTVGR